MESSRRAVEAYRRTRLIDGVTADDDKVAPVYKLDEISTVLQSAPLAVVLEMVEYIFKKLEHRSPMVKQKTLRLIKFVVGKSGSDFRREIQRQSAAIRQLFHYKGQPDALRGDSLNKAVRETAHEAITAMFASEDKAPAIEETSRRIEGFGSTNFDARMPQERKTLLSEVVDLGTTSFKQGLSIISNHYGQLSNSGSHSGFKSGGSNGSYQAPNFRRSSFSDRNSYRDSSRETLDSRDSYRSDRVGSYSSEIRVPTNNAETEQEASESDAEEGKENGSSITSEESLLNRFTPAGGVRLHPSREKVQAFVLEAQKLRSDRLFSAFEKRLQAQSWQVRLKTLCFLESILRQADVKVFGEVSSLFEENCACISECENSPQTSLRDRAKKVLQILLREESNAKTTPRSNKAVDLPDLMDTGGDNGIHLLADIVLDPHELVTPDPFAEAASTEEQDPFAGMSIHATQAETTSPESLLDMEAPPQKPSNTDGSSLFDGLSVRKEEAPQLDSLADLLLGFNVDDNKNQGAPLEALNSMLNQPSSSSSSSSFRNVSQLQGWPAEAPAVAQATGTTFSVNPIGVPLVFHPGFATFGQQSFPNTSAAAAAAGAGPQASFASLDGFDFCSNPYASAAGVTVRKEETKAFDFISDHISAARKK